MCPHVLNKGEQSRWSGVMLITAMSVGESGTKKTGVNGYLAS